MALRQLGVPHRIFATTLRMHYRSRLKLLFVLLPRLALFAIRSAIASMAVSRPRPDAVVLGSDIQILVFAAARFLLRRGSTRIVLNSFIFTARDRWWLNALRHAYYSMVLGCTDIAIVHSRLEAERYRALFPRTSTMFVFVPYGLDMPTRDRLFAEAALSHPAPERLVVSAGRSCRDYATLFTAVEGMQVQLRVICDYVGVLPPAPHADNITVVIGKYGEAYMREVLAADVVALPLAVADISVGQMVLIQAMGLGRAVAVTDTPTIRDYVTDGHDALLVPQGDPAAMRDVVQHLLDNPELRDRLGRNALATFERNHGSAGVLRRTMTAIGEGDRKMHAPPEA